MPVLAIKILDDSSYFVANVPVLRIRACTPAEAEGRRTLGSVQIPHAPAPVEIDSQSAAKRLRAFKPTTGARAVARTRGRVAADPRHLRWLFENEEEEE